MLKLITLCNQNFILPVFLVGLCASAAGQGFWTQRASLPDTGRADAMAFAIGNKGYVAQGGGGPGYARLWSVWEYDALTNSWLQKQNFTGGARWQGVSFSIGSKGYIATGVGYNSSINNDLWEYDPVADTWTQKANMPTPGRHFAAGFSIGNKGYVGLGMISSAFCANDFWEYDVVTNAWTQRANFPSCRTAPVGLSIGTKGYMGTGFDGSTLQNDFWEYDPATDIWTQKSNLPGPARHEIDGAHFVIGNLGYMGTGRTGTVYHNDFWRYNPFNDSWLQIPNLPAPPRIGAIAFTISSLGYVGLGTDGNGTCYTDLWSFSHEGPTGISDADNQKLTAHVYPNPFSEKTTLTLNDFCSSCSLEIYAASGQIIFSTNFSGTQIDITLPAHEYGLYFFSVHQETKIVAAGKLVVE